MLPRSFVSSTTARKRARVDEEDNGSNKGGDDAEGTVGKAVDGDGVETARGTAGRPSSSVAVPFAFTPNAVQVLLTSIDPQCMLSDDAHRVVAEFTQNFFHTCIREAANRHAERERRKALADFSSVALKESTERPINGVDGENGGGHVVTLDDVKEVMRDLYGVQVEQPSVPSGSKPDP